MIGFQIVPLDHSGQEVRTQVGPLADYRPKVLNFRLRRLHSSISPSSVCPIKWRFCAGEKRAGPLCHSRLILLSQKVAGDCNLESVIEGDSQFSI
jgi:hypothetical protein